MLAPSLYKRLSKIYNWQVLLFRYYSGAPLKGNLLALPTSIRLDWKGLPGTSALDYYENSKLTTVKSFITLATGTDECYFCFWKCQRKIQKSQKKIDFELLIFFRCLSFQVETTIIIILAKQAFIYCCQLKGKRTHSEKTEKNIFFWALFG